VAVGSCAALGGGGREYRPADPDGCPGGRVLRRSCLIRPAGKDEGYGRGRKRITAFDAAGQPEGVGRFWRVSVAVCGWEGKRQCRQPGVSSPGLMEAEKQGG
jgi:hypothetical protein